MTTRAMFHGPANVIVGTFTNYAQDPNSVF